jgi:2-polyprenyl-3-methyl-5-hydroxy-6-metoxy-1,4-benzoquinol methylase
VDGDLSRYEVDINLGNPNTSHSLVVDLVGRGKRVLDIGCWTGDLGRALITRDCTVSGLDVDSAAADKARADLDPVVVADLDEAPASKYFEAGSFDVVVLADVLEHLADPVAALADVATLLAPEGRIVVSVPNIAHGSVRLALLQGRWRYTESGLLDSTHIRFFTREGLFKLFEAAGLTIEDLRASLSDPLAVEVAVDPDLLPDTVVEWVRHQPDALVYQFVAAARPSREGEELTDAPLVPPVPEENIRAIDKYTEKFDQDLERRHRQLTVRDHIIGLEAATATAQTRADAAERQLKGARKRLERKNERIKALSDEIERLRTVHAEPGGALLRGALHRIRGGHPEQ